MRRSVLVVCMLLGSVSLLAQSKDAKSKAKPESKSTTSATAPEKKTPGFDINVLDKSVDPHHA